MNISTANHVITIQIKNSNIPFKYQVNLPRNTPVGLPKAFQRKTNWKYWIKYIKPIWCPQQGWSDHFVYAPSQCNVISHWVGAYTKQSLGCSAFFSCPPPDHRHPPADVKVPLRSAAALWELHLRSEGRRCVFKTTCDLHFAGAIFITQVGFQNASAIFTSQVRFS